MQTRTSRNRIITWLCFGMLLSCGVLYRGELLGQVGYAIERGKIRADIEHLSQLDEADIASLEQVSHAFSVIAEAVRPSVVHVQAARTLKALAPELEDLLQDKNIQLPPMSGTGSGVVIDEAGYIVTNNHVVADAESVHVALVDGRKYRAKVVGTDPMTDVALLRIKADRLHAAQFGDSDLVKAGHLVLAIGSPFQLAHSVSHGIVSALGRTDVQVDIDYQNWIQTDAAINPGNSGGPLINTRGEVIGLSVAIATESGAHQGVGFAIPANTVVRVAGQLKAHGSVVRGYLGIVIQQVDPRIAEAYGLAEPSGVFVGGIGKDTPAADSGLKAEDIIQKIDGRTIKTREELQECVANSQPGTEVEMTVWRNGAERKIPVVIGQQPSGFSTVGSIRDLDTRKEKKEEAEPKPQEPQETDIDPTSEESRGIEFPDLGITCETWSPALAKRFRLPDDLDRGAVVTDVVSTSEAYYAGLRRGVAIIAANGRDVTEAAQLQAIFTPAALSKGIRLKLQVGRDVFYAILQVQ